MKAIKWLSGRGRFSEQKEFAALLVSILRRKSVPIRDPEDREGWAYDFGGEWCGLPFEVIVGSTDEVRPWVARIEVQARFLSRILRRKTADEAACLADLCRKIHDGLAADERVDETRWYSDEAWMKDPDHGWTREP